MDLNSLAGRIAFPSFLYYLGSRTGFQAEATGPIPPGLEMLRSLKLDNLEFRPQRGGDLGERLLQAATEVLQVYDRVLLIGSDLPDLTAPILEEALEALADHDLAIGPAVDGGYYLLGLKQIERGLFTSGIGWGTDRVRRQTLLAASRAGLRVFMLSPMRDVDAWPDLQAYADRAGASVSGRLARILVQKYGHEDSSNQDETSEK